MMGQGRDLTALHRDGSEVPVEIGLSRVRWQQQAMTLAVVSDISVRKRRVGAQAGECQPGRVHLCGFA